MKITPLEINKQEFKKSLRGYDPIEVDTFLEMLGGEYEKLLQENKDLRKRVIEVETELKNYKEVEKTLKQTLMNVQESTHQTRENSRKEADLIRKEAELTAAEMLENAKREVHTMREEMVTLHTQKQSFVSRLRHILASHLELLEVLEIDDTDLANLKDRTKKVFSRADKTKGITEKSKSSKKDEPELQGSKEKSTENKKEKDSESEKLHGPDLFNDIFGDDVDIDNILK